MLLLIREISEYQYKDGITFIVWDGCPNYYSNGATHLFNIDTLRSSVEDVQSAVSLLFENFKAL